MPRTFLSSSGDWLQLFENVRIFQLCSFGVLWRVLLLLLLLQFPSNFCSSNAGRKDSPIVISDVKFTSRSLASPDLDTLPFDSVIPWIVNWHLYRNSSRFIVLVTCVSNYRSEEQVLSIDFDPVVYYGYNASTTTRIPVPCASNCSAEVTAYAMHDGSEFARQIKEFKTSNHVPTRPPDIASVAIINSTMAVHWEVQNGTVCGPKQTVRIKVAHLDREIEYKTAEIANPIFIDLLKYSRSASFAKRNYISVNVSMCYSNLLGFSQWSPWFSASGTGLVATTVPSSRQATEYIIIFGCLAGIICAFVVLTAFIALCSICLRRRKQSRCVADVRQLQQNPPELIVENVATMHPDGSTTYQCSDTSDDEESTASSDRAIANCISTV